MQDGLGASATHRATGRVLLTFNPPCEVVYFAVNSSLHTSAGLGGDEGEMK